VAGAQRRLFASIVRCGRAEVWRRGGVVTWRSGSRCASRISSWAARSWVAAAHALERLPTESAAFEAGSLSVDKVVELTRFATPTSEGELVSWAGRVTPATLRRRADLAPRGRTSKSFARPKRLATYGGGGKTTGWPAPASRAAFPRTKASSSKGTSSASPSAYPRCPRASSTKTVAPSPTRSAPRGGVRTLFVMASGELTSDPDPERATLVVHGPLDELTGKGVGGVDLGPGSGASHAGRARPARRAYRQGRRVRGGRRSPHPPGGCRAAVLRLPPGHAARRPSQSRRGGMELTQPAAVAPAGAASARRGLYFSGLSSPALRACASLVRWPTGPPLISPISCSCARFITSSSTSTPGGSSSPGTTRCSGSGPTGGPSVRPRFMSAGRLPG
jgi:hypothetical protein